MLFFSPKRSSKSALRTPAKVFLGFSESPQSICASSIPLQRRTKGLQSATRGPCEGLPKYLPSPSKLLQKLPFKLKTEIFGRKTEEFRRFLARLRKFTEINGNYRKLLAIPCFILFSISLLLSAPYALTKVYTSFFDSHHEKIVDTLLET